MNRFLVAAACAAVLGLGSAAQAHAQIVYGYTVPTYGGVETVGSAYSPFGGQLTFSNFYSPFTGANYTQTSAYAPGFSGGYYTQAYGYNPFTGYGYAYRGGVSNVALSPVTNPFTAYYNPFTGVTYYRRR
jgi:hypothetical protein